MGKVVLEVPEAMDVRLKARNFADAIRKLLKLKRASSRQGNLSTGIERFKGIAKHRNTDVKKDEWYCQ